MSYGLRERVHCHDVDLRHVRDICRHRRSCQPLMGHKLRRAVDNWTYCLKLINTATPPAVCWYPDIFLRGTLGIDFPYSATGAVTWCAQVLYACVHLRVCKSEDYIL